MKVGRLVFSVTCAIGLATVAAMPAHAAEARPWLCRSKPVFSSDSAMSYQVVNHGGCAMGVAIDAIRAGQRARRIRSRGLAGVACGRGQAGGTLAPGRYFAVAMYRGEGGRWICPGYAEDKDRPTGAVSRICYDEESPGCPVTLTVLSAAHAGAPSH